MQLRKLKQLQKKSKENLTEAINNLQANIDNIEEVENEEEPTNPEEPEKLTDSEMTTDSEKTEDLEIPENSVDVEDSKTETSKNEKSLLI